MNKQYLESLGTIKSVIVEESTGEVVNVNGKSRSKVIELSDILGSSIYNKNCRLFIEIILEDDNGDDLDDYTNEEIDDYLKYKRLKHGDMWLNQQFLVINGYKSIEEKQSKEINLDILNLKNLKIREKKLEKNKYSFLDTFYKKIHLNYLDTIINILNSYDEITVKKFYNCIPTTFNDKLPDKDVFKKYLELQINQYQPFINSNEKNLLKELYNIEPKGIGKFEILSAFMIPTCVINGGTSSYDASISYSYEDQINYINIEIKAPGALWETFRLGLKGQLLIYNFYDQTNDIISDSIKIKNQFGLDKIKELFKNNQSLFYYFEKITDNIIIDDEKDNFYTGMKRGELSSKYDRIFKPYCGFLAEYLNEIEHKEIYENRKKNTLHTKELKDEEDIREIFSIFKKYSFIQNPSNIYKIINEEFRDKVFKNIDFIITSRPDKFRVIDRNELSFYLITQGGCKGIETELFNMSKNIGYKFLVENSWDDYLKNSRLLPDKLNTFTFNYLENLSLLNVC